MMSSPPSHVAKATCYLHQHTSAHMTHPGSDNVLFWNFLGPFMQCSVVKVSVGLAQTHIFNLETFKGEVFVAKECQVGKR